MIQAQILALHTKGNDQKLKLQARYKLDYDQRICETPHFTPNTYVFLYSPTLRTNSSSAAKSLLMKEHHKLQLETLGPFRIISVQNHSVTTEENGISNKVSIDRVTDASSSPKPSSVSNE